MGGVLTQSSVSKRDNNPRVPLFRPPTISPKHPRLNRCRMKEQERKDRQEQLLAVQTFSQPGAYPTFSYQECIEIVLE